MKNNRANNRGNRGARGAARAAQRGKTNGAPDAGLGAAPVKAKTERADIVVVGAGASGLACAITAAREGRQVLVLEADESLGRSIKRTGDGRCNIANAHTEPSVYRNGAFVAHAFEACSPAQALAFLESCGIVMRTEAQGRMYPQANKAVSVVDALLASAHEAGVRIRPNTQVRRVVCESNAYVLETTKGLRVRCHSLALCMGGSNAAGLVPDDVPQTPFHPVLGPLACDPDPLRGLDKIRSKCALTCHGVREQGEVTFRTYGVSGIAAFNLSRIAQPGDALAIDFLPELEQGAATQAFLEKRFATLGPCNWGRFCAGMLLPLVARAVLRSADLREDQPVRADDLPAFGRALRSFPLTVRGIGNKMLCQVHRGGVDVQAVDPATMQVSGHARLFVCGEALDVDAPCGGYNLHWAWASGILAGKAAAKR